MIIRRMLNFPNFNWTKPFEELEKMKQYIDQRFVSGLFPLVNITEDRDKYSLRAELPGIKVDELEIHATGNSIAIQGERKIPFESEHVKYHRRERESGKFSRILNLPSQIDSDKVEAKLVDGILTVLLPKAAIAIPKQISIKR